MLTALDMLLIAYTILIPNPFFDGILAAGQQLRWGNESYVYILIAGSVFSYSPKAVLWTGVMGAVGWTLGFLWILDQPGSYLAGVTLDMIAWPVDKLHAFVGDPNRLDAIVHAKVVLLFILVSAVLAIAMGRVRNLVRRQSIAERERANLARYFSPNMVDKLAESDEPLGTVRTQNVAVLFADIVGFTEASATEHPESVIRMLREFHARMERAVFAHAGTLDKYPRRWPDGDFRNSTRHQPRRIQCAGLRQGNDHGDRRMVDRTRAPWREGDPRGCWHSLRPRRARRHRRPKIGSNMRLSATP